MELYWNSAIYVCLMFIVTVASIVAAEINRKHPEEIEESLHKRERRETEWLTYPLHPRDRARNDDHVEAQRSSRRNVLTRSVLGIDDVFSVRLVGGDTVNRGRVEVRRNSGTGAWGMVCDDHWSFTNAYVICRMLGYRGAMSKHLRANVIFGTGSGDFVMDDVICEGDEETIGDCQFNGDTHNCDRETEAAGVTCLIDVVDEDHPECFILDNGADYRGTVSQTLSGIPCQAWSEQEPHQHEFYPASFPGYGIGEHNYCRSFGRAPKPWCFTTNPEVQFEYCGIGEKQPVCRNPSSPECYMEMNGSDYRGFVSHTIAGRECIDWNDDSTFTHDFLPENYPGQGLGGHNYCRNVNGQSTPWCITDDPNSESHWEFCEVADTMQTCDREVPLILGLEEEDILNSFMIVDHAAIPGHNRRVIINVTPSNCAHYCLIEDDFTCRSFDYSNRLNRCWLSDKSSHQVSLTLGEDVNVFTYYERLHLGATGQFTMTRNRALEGTGTEILQGVSLHTCASSCLVASFGCASFDYESGARNCWINDVAVSAGILGRFEDDPYDHFRRNGAAQPDCYSGDGQDYQGFVSSTEEGRLCTNWLVAQEFGVGVTNMQYPDGDIEDHNYCRNPDEDLRPWCYYGNSEGVVTSWLYCDIPSCDDDIVVPEPTQEYVSTTLPTNPLTLLSEGKDAFQSSTLDRYGFTADASLALDGDTNPQYRQGSCSSTVREEDGWWYVDLGGVHNVEYVEVFNQFDQPLRIRRTDITVGIIPTDLSTFVDCGTIKKGHAQESASHPDRLIRVTCPEQIPGRYVRFQMKRRDFLTLCEVRVWGYEGSLTCGARQFLCHSLDACISDTFLCDREADCSDGSDEELCVYPENLFSEFEDRALPNAMPIVMYRNKLVEDCAQICLYDLNLTCRSFEYQMVQQSCRFFNKTRADTGGLTIMTGYNHYELKSQINCPTDDENYHPCPSGSCIESSKLCNNRNDCEDFSDEMNCGQNGEYSIRLSNGTAPNEGRVEVNYDGQWGLVCDDSWDLEDANVVCKELGYERGASKALTVAAFGHGNRGIFLDDVACFGTEASLKDCPHSGWGIHNCVMGESAGVQCWPDEECTSDQFMCSNKNCVDEELVCNGNSDCGDLSDERNCETDFENIRFVNVNSSAEGQGRLEVFYRGRWGTVCDTGFSREEALVVCKQMGYTGQVEVFPGAHFGRGSRFIAIANVACRGNEFSLSECSFIPGKQSGCTHHQDVGIECGTEQIIPNTCGERSFENGASVRIVGGLSAKRGSWPWQAQLIRKENGAHVCGATLIDDRHVLSAAHCFQTYQDFIVRLGKHDLRTTQTSEQDFSIDCLFRHERYDTTTTNNDIILIRLNRKDGKGVSFTPYVRPICLPEINEFEDGHKCWISGWGNTGFAYPNLLQEAPIPLLSREVCTRRNVYGSKLTEQMICAGMLAGGIDTCDGDSGGPLQCKNEETNTWKLWGITSWGYGCAEPNAPGVYAKVTEYLEWIERKRGARSC